MKTKTLKVIKPFGVMENGDEFVLNEKTGMYSSEYKETTTEDTEDNSFYAEYNSVYTISPEYAQALIDEGFLSENEDSSTFVNVFDEIDNLASGYVSELNNLEADCKNVPACVKVEKETVLKNILKVLSHLKSLKK